MGNCFRFFFHLTSFINLVCLSTDHTGYFYTFSFTNGKPNNGLIGHVLNVLFYPHRCECVAIYISVSSCLIWMHSVLWWFDHVSSTVVLSLVLTFLLLPKTRPKKENVLPFCITQGCKTAIGAIINIYTCCQHQSLIDA